MTLPQFWLAPLENELDDWERLAGAALALAAARGTLVLVVVCIGFAEPKMIWECPPAGAWIRVEDRPVITLPQFCFAPLENLLEDTTGAGPLAPKLIWERPPAGAWIRVEDRPVITLPQFCVAPLENLLLETTGAGPLDPKQIWDLPPPALRPRCVDILR